MDKERKEQTMTKLELEAVKEGISHAKREILDVNPSLNPICVEMIAQFSAAFAIRFYIENQQDNMTPK